jgi:hypothetical protein
MSKNHLVPTGTTQPSTTYKTFDLNTFLDELPSAYVRMQALQSYAWRIDTLITQAVRTLFKAVREEAKVGGIDSLDTFADYNNALAEQDFAEQCFLEIGSASAGPVTSIHELLDIRAEAHQLAYDATRQVLDWKGNLRTYIIPDLEDVIGTVGTMKPKATTVARINQIATRNASKVATGKDVAILAEKLAAPRLKRESNRLTSMAESLKAQVGAVSMMFNIAVRNRPERMNKSLDFHGINIETQRTLIASAKQALDRAEEFATSDDNMSDNEFDGVTLCVELAKNTLDAVLRSPRFNNGVNGNATPIDYTPKPSTLKPKSERPVLPKPLPKPKPAKAAKPKTIKAKAVVVPLEDLKTAIEFAPNDL